MKLSVFFGVFFSLLAFARANEDVAKIDYISSLCRAGRPETIHICLSTTLELPGYMEMSRQRLALDICPSAGGPNQSKVIDCFNAANRVLRLNLASCNPQRNLDQRVACIKTLVTQSENTRRSSSRKAAKDNSDRFSAPVKETAPRRGVINSGSGVVQ